MRKTYIENKEEYHGGFTHAQKFDVKNIEPCSYDFTDYVPPYPIIIGEYPTKTERN